jgi:RNA-directed DNA polymerase
MPQPAFTQDLFQQFLQPLNLQRAWQQVKSNKGASGIDGMSIDDFSAWAQQGGWQTCKVQLEQGEYQPKAVKRVEIDKPDGTGKRKLGIPIVLDRIIGQAISQVLTPLFDPSFSANSFGFRSNKNAQQAVMQVRDIIKTKRKYAVDVDLSKFFDRVNHDLWMSQLKPKVQDKRLLTLIGKYLRAGVMVNKKLAPTVEGVPQGSPLSPYFSRKYKSNIMLDNLDKELESRGHNCARYADDFIILVKSKRAGERVLASITHYLATKLKLVVNEQKSQVVMVGKSKFLGFTFNRGKIQWHAKTLHIFKQKTRRLRNRNWGVSMGYQLFKVSQYLRGWVNYFGIANAYQGCVDLDHWILPSNNVLLASMGCASNEGSKLTKAWCKDPVGSCLWDHKQRALGRSKTPGINQALSNSYLMVAGLYSLRDGWIKFQYPDQKT